MTPGTDVATRQGLVGTALEKNYGPVPALRGVSVTLAPGEIVAITGPSGSGKSTLLHCLAGIVRPDAGAVEFGGQRVDGLSESDRSRLRRSRFGILFQFGQLIPELTAEENVALPLLLAGQPRARAMAIARRWLDAFAVGELAGGRPGQLSGGQGQRVAMARAMVTDPEVVFADEPTGSLDSLAGEQVLTALVRAARETATAVAIVTHDARVAAYADREVSLRDGRLDGDGR